MKTIVLANTKGGAAKTGTAIGLLGAAVAYGHRAIGLDFDSQRSFVNWGDTRRQHRKFYEDMGDKRKADKFLEKHPEIIVGAVEKEQDPRVLLEKAKKQGVEFCIIDTGLISTHRIDEIMALGDIVIVTSFTSKVSVQSTMGFLDFIQEAKESKVLSPKLPILVTAVATATKTDMGECSKSLDSLRANTSARSVGMTKTIIKSAAAPADRADSDGKTTLEITPRALGLSHRDLFDEIEMVLTSKR